MLSRKVKSAVRIFSEGGTAGLVDAIKRNLGFSTDASVDEVAMAAEALDIQRFKGVMVDVGAHYGGTSLPFCEAGWKVIAFEPDSRNRSQLQQRITGFRDFIVDSRAVSNAEQDAVTFYRSSQSTGISGLSAFHETHVAADTVAVTTLGHVVDEYALDRLDFLKIDTEGFDLFVLQGLPWEQLRPQVIVCEFEDAKTIPLGYTFREFATYLVDKGYQVMVSEWEPIVAYGGRHTWSGFKVFPCELESSSAWGNFIAVVDPAVFSRLERLCAVESRRRKPLH